jgi:hypothetical protein
MEEEEILLAQLYDDVEEIQVTPPNKDSQKEEVKVEVKDKEEEEVKVKVVEPEVVLEDLYEEGDEEEDEEEEGTTKDKAPKAKPGRKSKNETFTREEALRAAAKKFGEMFGVTDEDVSFDDLTEEGVVDFVDQLATQLKENTYNSIKNSDDITKTLLEYKETGGDPLDILEVYKKQNEVEKIEITDERGQRKVVSKYYKEVLGWSDDEIDDHIESLSATEKLEKEAGRLKSKFDKVFEEEKEVKIANQQKQQQREIQLLQQKQLAFSKAIDSNKISKKESQELSKIAFGTGRLPDGRVMDMFDYEVAKIQRDPEKYLDLVRFINNKEEYLKSLGQERSNEVNNDSFKKALNIKSSRKIDSLPAEKQTKNKFNFNI